jgi:YrbI family 3-deoxy-D-manno-octulosonate 8-phosphate phosphatase
MKANLGLDKNSGASVEQEGMSMEISDDIVNKARRIQLLITDCDGVLTDGGVYYFEHGEVFKKFNVRDGMGVERLRRLAEVETGIISGELSLSIRRRAEKLGIEECHLGIKHKGNVVLAMAARKDIPLEAIAYIGDDVNDLEAFDLVGLCACPNDALSEVKARADYVCRLKGGEGAFREFAEVILASIANSSCKLLRLHVGRKTLELSKEG